MNPVGAATISTAPMTPRTVHHRFCARHAQFNVDLRTVGLRAAGLFRSPFAASAERVLDRGAQRPLSLSIARHLHTAEDPGPAADFAFFREPLKRNRALLDKWGAAATAGSQSEAWSHFVKDISGRFFKGSRKQRVMDALMLSIDILPPNRRADALACMLADGDEGRAAAEEFWEYIGLDRIPDGDKDRVRDLIRQYEIGM